MTCVKPKPEFLVIEKCLGELIDIDTVSANELLPMCPSFWVGLAAQEKTIAGIDIPIGRRWKGARGFGPSPDQFLQNARHFSALVRPLTTRATVPSPTMSSRPLARLEETFPVKAAPQIHESTTTGDVRRRSRADRHCAAFRRPRALRSHRCKRAACRQVPSAGTAP